MAWEICYGCETWKETGDDKWRHLCNSCRAKYYWHDTGTKGDSYPKRRRLLDAYAFLIHHESPLVEVLEDLVKVRKQSAKRIAEIDAEEPQKESKLRAYGERNLQDVRDAAQAALDMPPFRDDAMRLPNEPTSTGWWWGRERVGLAWRPWRVVVQYHREGFGLCVEMPCRAKEPPSYEPFRFASVHWGPKITEPEDDDT